MLVPKTSQKFRGAQVALLQNSVGHRLKGPKLRGEKVEGSKTLHGKYWRQICPVEFWTPHPVPRRVLDPLTCTPRGVLEQCNLCPAECWRHSFRDQHITRFRCLSPFKIGIRISLEQSVWADLSWNPFRKRIASICFGPNHSGKFFWRTFFNFCRFLD